MIRISSTPNSFLSDRHLGYTCITCCLTALGP